MSANKSHGNLGLKWRMFNLKSVVDDKVSEGGNIELEYIVEILEILIKTLIRSDE